MATRKKSLWLSYDFGLKGNYSSLFTFLDNHDAIDCGNNLAYFKYDNNDLLKPDELIEKLKNELIELIIPSPNDRIYVIWRDDDEKPKTKVRGQFIFGKRKTPAWNGYGTNDSNSKADEAI